MGGRHQVIDVGPMSGKSNVIYWLNSEGIKPSDDIVDAVFDLAKSSDRILSREEILGVVEKTSS